tara:strand:+ start:59 stop:175 length:117 start_codon:yes stop_codon:yes gene_type:complete
MPKADSLWRAGKAGVTGAGWNIHKIIEITDAGKGDTSS